MPRRAPERPSRAFRRTRRYQAAAADVGSRVRALRQGAGWTLERAAEKMGLDFRHLQQIEAGTVNVTLATILRIVDAFGVSPYLIVSVPPKAGSRRSPDTNLEYGPKRPRTKAMPLPAIRALDNESRPRGKVKSAQVYLPNPTPEPTTQEAQQRRVGRTISRFRKANGLTQAQLAGKVGVSVKYVQKVEAGLQNLTIGSLVRFANALQVEIEHLFSLAP